MKQFLFIAALFVLLSHTATARVPITLRNNTGCDITVIIRGDVNGAPCNGKYESQPITVPANGGFVFYNDPPSVPGGLNCPCAPPSLGILDPFTVVELLDRDPGACAGVMTMGFIGIPCSPNPLSFGPYPVLDGSCLPCGNVTATWDLSTATVIFN